MAINGLNIALSGIKANQFRQNVTANNIANVNTDGFKAASVQTTDSAAINGIGQGTRVAATYEPARPQPTTAPLSGTTPVGTPAEASTTDLIRETTNRMAAQSAYAANVGMARTVDQTSQTLLDLKR